MEATTSVKFRTPGTARNAGTERRPIPFAWELESRECSHESVRCGLSIAKPFDSADHIFELKHDGFRSIAYIENRECKLVSRNLNNFKSFEGLRKSLADLAGNAILDGEIVCLDIHGISQFDKLNVPARSSRFLCIRFALVEWRGFADVSADRSKGTPAQVG
jgi:bifunctional non-homologous end joining protein LigD